MTEENEALVTAALSQDYNPKKEYTASEIASIEGVSWKTVTRWREIGITVRYQSEPLCLVMYRKKQWVAKGKSIIEFKMKRNGLSPENKK